MNHLEIYDKVRKVPDVAQKPIKGGRLKGFTDINPMWRIKTLTEQFGMVGIGWYYDITEKRFEKGGNDEIAVFVDIDLFIKVDDEWSKPIPGTGGSIFVAKESKGLFTSDECIKMALTDALSVACKSIGMGADVYWQKDSNKYDKEDTKPIQTKQNVTNNSASVKHVCADCGASVKDTVVKYSNDRFKKTLCFDCQKKQ